jgi:hypothetical protein
VYNNFIFLKAYYYLLIFSITVEVYKRYSVIHKMIERDSYGR